MTTSENRTFAFDLAAIITLCGIVLYFFGILNTKAYFDSLDVPGAFLDLSVERILSSTWLLIFIVIICMGHSLASLLYIYRNEDYIYRIDAIGLIAFGIIFSSGTILFGFIYDYFFAFMTGLATVYFIYIIFVYKKVERFGKVKKDRFVIIFSGATLMLSLIVFPLVGKKSAEIFRDSYEENVSLKLKDNNVVHGKFITYTNDNYFILIENSDCTKETALFNKEEVLQVEFKGKKKEQLFF